MVMNTFDQQANVGEAWEKLQNVLRKFPFMG